jgi:hypothetical protein
MNPPTYSPDLAPCDYWPFPKLKNAQKGQRFADIPYIHCNVVMLLWGITENNFQNWFWQWHPCLTKCVATEGEYFEDDSSR